MFQFALQIGQRPFDGLNEVEATPRHAAQRKHRLPFRVIVGDHQHLAESAEPVRRALNHVFGRLTGLRVEDFQFRVGLGFWRARRRARAVENDGDRRADGIAVLREDVDQFFARSRGMPRLAGRERRPIVQQTVAIHEYAHQSHCGNGTGAAAKWAMQIYLDAAGALAASGTGRPAREFLVWNKRAGRPCHCTSVPADAHFHWPELCYSLRQSWPWIAIYKEVSDAQGEFPSREGSGVGLLSSNC